MGNKKERDLRPTSTVMAIHKIKIEGNIIPSIWFRRLTFENGKPCAAAAIILSEIVWWYQPTEVRDERSKLPVTYTRKFYGEMLQKSYQALAEEFGYTKRQVRDAIDILVKMKLIRRVFDTVVIDGRAMNNVMFLEPIPTAIKALCDDKKPYPYDILPSEGVLSSDIAMTTERETNTSTTHQPHNNINYDRDEIFDDASPSDESSDHDSADSELADAHPESAKRSFFESESAPSQHPIDAPKAKPTKRTQTERKPQTPSGNNKYAPEQHSAVAAWRQAIEDERGEAFVAGTSLWKRVQGELYGELLAYNPTVEDVHNLYRALKAEDYWKAVDIMPIHLANRYQNWVKQHRPMNGAKRWVDPATMETQEQKPKVVSAGNWF